VDFSRSVSERLAWIGSPTPNLSPDLSIVTLSFVRGETFDFRRGGGGRFGKKIPCSRPRKEKKTSMVGSEEKNTMYGWCGKKKFLQIIDIFQWVGWLVQIPACSVANQSYVVLFKQPTLSQKQEFVLSSVNKVSFKIT